MEISILLGIYLLTVEVFWFYLGITITLTILISILILYIFMSSSQKENGNKNIFDTIKSERKLIDYEGSSNHSIPQVINETEELIEIVLPQDTNSKTKVLALTNQFGTLISEIKSRIDQKREKIEIYEISKKIKEEILSDIKTTFTAEFEKLNLSFEEKIEKFSMIEETLNSKLENLGNDFSNDLNNKLELFLGNLNPNLNTEGKSGKIMEQPDDPDTDRETIIIPDSEQGKAKKNPTTDTPKGSEYDEETEKLLSYVKAKYDISREDSIDLLQRIETHLGKVLSNRDYFINKTLDDLKEILETRSGKKTGKKETPRKESKKEPKKKSLQLMGREIEVLEISNEIQEIGYKGTKFKMQKTMSGKSLSDFGEMEKRIKKFFKKREILIVYCKNIEKYFIYYKK